jgi:hypothetical protein
MNPLLMIVLIICLIGIPYGCWLDRKYDQYSKAEGVRNSSVAVTVTGI